MSAVLKIAEPESVDSSRASREAAPAERFRYEFATSPAEVIESQRLRYRVFAQELGATVQGAEQGLDRDSFDAHCWHLLVRENATNQVVASTRILTDDRAWRLGGFYSSREFDLGAIAGRYGRTMEVGRTCVDARYRSGPVITHLWQGIGEFLAEYGFDSLIGCASVEMHDGGRNLAAVMASLEDRHLLAASQTVKPMRSLPTLPEAAATAVLPPLLKGYLRLGARLGRVPCWDPDFVCADFLVLLNVRDMAPRYARHFLKRRSPVAA